MKKMKSRILTLLEEGKITADEAHKLLEAIKPNDCDYDTVFSKENVEEKLNSFSQSVDSFAKEFSDKINEVYKGMEPTVKKTTKVVVEKTVKVLDEISKSLSESIQNIENAVQEGSECSCQDVCNCAEKAVEEVSSFIDEAAKGVSDFVKEVNENSCGCNENCTCDNDGNKTN